MRQAIQLSFSLEPGLTAQYRSLREVAAATVYASKKGVSGVAGHLDMSPTDLTKRLNSDGAEPRPLRVEDLEGILQSTGDFRAIHWLIEKFLRDPIAIKEQAVGQLAQLVPQLMELVKQAGLEVPK
jgi:hypothetical protein